MASPEVRIPLDRWVSLHAGDGGPQLPAGARPDPLPAHVGLWLDRCLVEPAGKDGDKDHPGRRALYDAACNALEPDGEPPAVAHYRPLFKRWERLARGQHAGVMARVREVRTRSRLLLHPDSAGSVTDGSILLHHTYGVPYLPGTALKGLCRAYAERLAREGGAQAMLSPPSGSLAGDWVDQLFGDVPTANDGCGAAGLFDFWDALWVPPEAGRSRERGPLALDVVNPHHSEYYTGGSAEQRSAPRESDAPIPTHRLTVGPGARFLIRVEALKSTALRPWLEWVVDGLLLPAFDAGGIGTRTTSGYGRLVPVDALPGAGGGVAAAGGGEGARGSAPARLSRTRNDGALHATFDDGKVATLRGNRARELYQGLSQAVRKRIDRNKPVLLQVTWVKVGNARSIDGIQESP